MNTTRRNFLLSALALPAVAAAKVLTAPPESYRVADYLTDTTEWYLTDEPQSSHCQVCDRMIAADGESGHAWGCAASSAPYEIMGIDILQLDADTARCHLRGMIEGTVHEREFSGTPHDLAKLIHLWPRALVFRMSPEIYLSLLRYRGNWYGPYLTDGEWALRQAWGALQAA